MTRLRPAQTIGGQGLSSLASGLIVATLIIVFLYVGREILEPLVIAVLIGFILAPLIRRLRNLGLWRVPSVILAVLFATAVIGALGSTIVMQVAQLADDLPKYETNLRAKIRAFGGGALTSSALERASGALKDLQSEISPPGACGVGSKAPTGGGASTPPSLATFFQPFRSAEAAKSRTGVCRATFSPIVRGQSTR